MTNIIEMPAFTLRKGVSESEFLLAHEKFNREFVSKQKGYISHKLLNDGTQYFDLVIWESMEYVENAFKAIYENSYAKELMAFIDDGSTDEDIPLFSIVKSY